LKVDLISLKFRRAAKRAFFSIQPNVAGMLTKAKEYFERGGGEIKVLA